MGFFGVNFWSRDFLGILLEALRIFVGFDVCPPFDHPCHLKSRVSPALGGGGAYSVLYTVHVTSMKLQTIIELKYLKEGVTNTNGKGIFIFPF